MINNIKFRDNLQLKSGADDRDRTDDSHVGNVKLYR